MSKQQTNFYDVVIVGAGLSGIGAAYHLMDKCPHLRFTIIEARSNVGGTWDLFRYPGIRSDSDMYTFGFKFFPWKDAKPIADGPSILKYINETADEFSIREKIQFNKKVVAASWSSQDQKWRLDIAAQQEEVIHCNYLFMCSGYYDYAQGYQPSFPDFENFQGKLIHPQHWDQNLDYTNKEIVIVGSGATAVTLLPKLAEKAKKVTMLQRTPTFMMSRDNNDFFARRLKKILPPSMAHQILRWKNILLTLFFYKISKKYPDKIRDYLKKKIKEQLGDLYQEKDFNPHYNPWDQRLCVVPNNDLFQAIKLGKASVETNTIESFSKNEILLRSGKKLYADIIVSATGLKVQMFGGMKVFVDEEEIDVSQHKTYKGVLLSGVPNFAINLGYTNASWTLKSDLNCEFVTRILNHMKKKNYTSCTPVFDTQMKSERLLDLDAGYLKRAQSILPKQGEKEPWKVRQNHIKEIFSLRYGKINTKYLHYK